MNENEDRLLEAEDSGPEKIAVPREVYQIMIHGLRGRSWSTISDRLVRLLSISGSKEQHPQNYFYSVPVSQSCSDDPKRQT